MIEEFLQILTPEPGMADAVIFCGAGVSSGSGIPLASDLKEMIMNSLTADRDRGSYTIEKIPLELAIEALLAFGEGSQLINLFNKGYPNSTHFFIAYLLMNRLSLRTNDRAVDLTYPVVATTNFDSLIELAGIKLRKSNDLLLSRSFSIWTPYATFPNVCPPEDASWFDELRTPTIIKLHGTAARGIDGMMGLTQETLAEFSKSKNLKKALRYIFVSGPHAYVIILGYSCKDNLDINPMLRELSANRGIHKKRIILIKHDQNRPIRRAIKGKLDRVPFKGFDGCSIRVDTDALIHGLIKRLDIPPSPYKKRNIGLTEFAILLRHLKCHAYLRHSILGYIFCRCNRFSRAKQLLKKALEESPVSFYYTYSDLLKKHITICSRAEGI